MKLVKVDKMEIARRYRSNIRLLIEEFINSDMDTCEVVFADGEYKSTYVCATTWRRAIKRYGYVGLMVYATKEHVYIQKVEVDTK